MANIRLREGQVDPKHPHATSVKGAVKSYTDVNTVVIKGKKGGGDATTWAPISEVREAEEVDAVKESIPTKYKVFVKNWDYKTSPLCKH